ncbi:MAG: hypothetical protein Kow0069_01440 [Promethearchaeota archaeon]
MKAWEVTVEFDGSSESDVLNLTDLQEVTSGYYDVARAFFDDLLESIKKSRQFVVGKKIKHVKGPDDEDWTQNPWLLLLARIREKEVPFWALIKRKRDLTGTLVAVGPEEFVKFVKKNGGEELKKVLEYLVTFPKKFNLVVLIPAFLA